MTLSPAPGRHRTSVDFILRVPLRKAAHNTPSFMSDFFHSRLHILFPRFMQVVARIRTLLFMAE